MELLAKPVSWEADNRHKRNCKILESAPDGKIRTWRNLTEKMTGTDNNSQLKNQTGVTW